MKPTGHSPGRIVAELVVTEIINTGRYQVEERLLMLSGVIDESQASRIGRLYAIDALVSGSVMQIGSQITLTGRLIQVETGEVLKTATVSMSSIDALPREAQVLANGLADIPREAFEIREDLAARQWRRVEIGADIAATGNIADESGVGLGMIVRYTPPLMSVWLEGVPVGGAKSIQIGGVFNPIPILGVGGNWGMYFDDNIDYVELSYAQAGVLVRPRLDIEAGLFFGGSLSGTVWTTDNGKISDVAGTWRFPSNFSVWLMYKFNDKLAVRARYLGVSLGEFAEEIEDWEADTGRSYFYPGGDLEYDGSTFTLGIVYSLIVG